MSQMFSKTRRNVLVQGAALGISPMLAGPLAAATASTASNGSVRLAFLLGNRDYPAQQDLPPITKNIRDLKAALEAKGFSVTDALNLDLAKSKTSIADFAKTVKAAPADATIFFYFTGHGVQDEARNLLIGAGVNPGQIGEVQNGSLELAQDVVGPLAPRASGATYAVIDSCRVSIRSAIRDRDGLNQVEAPVGCLIAFSTAAGKPAISPAVETENTFYTASLVKVLNAAADDTSFADLFRLVRRDVRDTMLNHPINAVRLVAQDPFIADNTQISVPLHPRPRQAEVPVYDAAQSQQMEEALWAQIQDSLWPSDITKLAATYLEQFPKGRRLQSVEVARDGALEAAKILQRNDVKLYRSSFQAAATLGDATKRDIVRAARGDKDAAKRIGVTYKDGGTGQALGRYEGWLQYAAMLGNGIASYDLALYYRKLDQPDFAARYEARARELGFTPPPSLKSGRN